MPVPIILLMIKAATSRRANIRGASTLGSAPWLSFSALRGGGEPLSGSLRVVWPRVGISVDEGDVDIRFSMELLESVRPRLVGDLGDVWPLIVLACLRSVQVSGGLNEIWVPWEQINE